MSYPPPPGQPQGHPQGYPQGYAAAPQHTEPPTRPGRDRRPLVLAAAAGFVLAAVIALVLSLVGAWPGSGDDSDGPSSASVSLPDKVGSYVRYDQLKLSRTERGKKIAANVTASDAKTAQALSAAHEGAGAAVRAYGSEDLLTQFRIWVVRDRTPRPVVTYEDAAYDGYARPQQVVRQYGKTWCQLFDVNPTPAGQKPKGTYIATLCVRSEGNLTVQYVGGGATDLSKHPDRVASVIDEVWDSIA